MSPPRIALMGNPNVGKSTVFNALTGLKQHTGNWPGKTVGSAQGVCRFEGREYALVDLPGCYSLLSHSPEEEAARDYLCLERPDAVVIVSDASCLERNLILALQVLEITPKAVLCVNLLDEARRRGVRVDLEELSLLLGAPVVGTEARSGKGLEALMAAAGSVISAPNPSAEPRPAVPYPAYLEEAIEALLPALEPICAGRVPPRWAAVKLLCGEENVLPAGGKALFGADLRAVPGVQEALAGVRTRFRALGISAARPEDDASSAAVAQAERIARAAVRGQESGYSGRDRKLDRLFIGKYTGIPILLLLLLGIFWLTMQGANIPSAYLSQGLFWLGERLRTGLVLCHAPGWLSGLLIDGMYRTLSWVVSVMLPPMAIFFPLFTLLEDLGYLPRAAFTLDRCFQKCGACGKQALTTAMGFGCNAVGVTGARIIDSPRERLIAILTNSFVPCNGRLPMLTALIAMFLVGLGGSSLLSAATLLGVILLGMALTLLMAKLLSATVLRGVPSAFTLELPPYRLPQVGKVLIRSVLDRTLFVLGRAAAVAAPAGLLIWVLANVRLGGAPLLAHLCGALDPLGRLLGMDGVILLAFLLGWPANEIVIPIMLMAYTAQGSLVAVTDLSALERLLAAHGWTYVTALCTMLFSLLHWPCSTTCLTIYKETKSLRWTALSILLPTLCGTILCFAVASLARFLGA